MKPSIPDLFPVISKSYWTRWESQKPAVIHISYNWEWTLCGCRIAYKWETLPHGTKATCKHCCRAIHFTLETPPQKD